MWLLHLTAVCDKSVFVRDSLIRQLVTGNDMKPRDTFTRSSVNLQQLKVQQTPKEKSSTSKLRVRLLSHGVHVVRFAFVITT